MFMLDTRGASFELGTHNQTRWKNFFIFLISHDLKFLNLSSCGDQVHKMLLSKIETVMSDMTFNPTIII